MNSRYLKLISKHRPVAYFRRLYEYLAPRSYTVIMWIALFYTLAVKYFHSTRYTSGVRSLEYAGSEFFGWILADVAFFLAVEAFLSLSCWKWPRKWMVRTATIIAAVFCTWSVMNAAWVIRTGTQILPRVLLSLVRAPINSLFIVCVNLASMPVAALVLLVPSGVALVFFISCLVHPRLPAYNHRRFRIRIIICVMIAAAAVAARPAFENRVLAHNRVSDLWHNSQLRAVMSLAISDYRAPPDPTRTIASFDQIAVESLPPQIKQNVVVVVLEGVQHRYTSLVDDGNDLTPYLASLAAQGVEFSNARSTLTHTTKALFALFSGRRPSASQDIVEAVPAVKPYGGLATILAEKLDYRTAFFQSAMGSFEARPGLVYNLGFQKFWARDDLGDPNAFVGYLGADEFSMLEPVAGWIRESDKPFLAVLLCSVTHDPYEVPEWFGEPGGEPIERYRQAIRYTDKFLAALDVELTNLGLANEMIFCVVGDHGEAFGEHGLFGHERIAFDELLRIPFCLRAPYFAEPGKKITRPVSSIDLTPTLLALLGFGTGNTGFDGANALAPLPNDRKVYFSGWMREGPAGFVQDGRKFVYHPTEKSAYAYDVESDPLELVRIELPETRVQQIADDVVVWRTETFFKPDQRSTGRQVLFGRWLCRWADRVASAKYKKQPE